MTSEKRWNGVMSELAQIPPRAFLESYKPLVVLNGLTQRSPMSSEHWPETEAAKGKNATLFVQQDDGTWSPLAEVKTVKLEYAQGIEPTAVYKDELHKWKHYADNDNGNSRNAYGDVLAEQLSLSTRGLQGFHYHKAKRRLKKGDRKIARSLTSS